MKGVRTVKSEVKSEVESGADNDVIRLENVAMEFTLSNTHKRDPGNSNDKNNVGEGGLPGKADNKTAENQRAGHAKGTHEVFAGLSLTIQQGEKVGVVGRNGAGKSTLLRIMAGIYAPVSGKVWRRSDATLALLSLGLGFQKDLTGRENTYLSALLQGISRREAKRRLDAIGEFAELGDYYDEPVKSYSNGMRARLGFGSAMLLDTEIMLIDETLSVGDQQFRKKAREALGRKLDAKRTVILVHHAEQALREICTRAIWLDRGRVQADGSVEDVLAAYSAAG